MTCFVYNTIVPTIQRAMINLWNVAINLNKRVNMYGSVSCLLSFMHHMLFWFVTFFMYIHTRYQCKYTNINNI